MKKRFKIKSLVAVALLLFVIGCSSDDDVNDQPNNPITVQDFSAMVNENPVNGQALGTVQASSNQTLNYSITSSTPMNALSINANTGELTVADETLFDFETNSIITATITVENSTDAESLTVTIDVTNINEVGDYNYGGVIFWVNATGNEGLVLALNNQSTNSPWGGCIGTATGATGTAIGDGTINTNIIVSAGCVPTGSAVELVSNLSLNGYDDWFLPSSGEWGEVYNNLSIIKPVILSNGGDDFLPFYWCSNESDAYNAGNFLFSPPGDGVAYYFNKSTSSGARAVRAWTDF